MTHRRPEQMTAVKRTVEGGWIVEAEVVEDRRISPFADMLALYEIKLDGDGNLLAYRRTRRYMRGQSLYLDADRPDLHRGGAQQT